LIASFVQRLVVYIALLGGFIYVIAPSISFLLGKGYSVNEYAWVLIVPVGITYLYNEIRRYRKTHPRNKLQ